MNEKKEKARITFLNINYRTWITKNIINFFIRMDIAKGGERVSKLPKDRYSHQTFYTCEGGYDDIEPDKAEPDYSNILKY